MHVVFGSDARTLTIEGPAGPAMDAVSGLFRGLQRRPPDVPVAPAPEGGSPPPDLVLRRAADGWELTSPRDPESLRFRDPSDLVRGLEFGITSFLLGLESERTHLHGAAAVVPGVGARHAVLALGVSGAGKSSLALAWSRAGLPLLGDDTLLVGEAGRLFPFPRLVKVARARLEDAGLAPCHDLLTDPTSAEVRYDPAAAGGWAQGPAQAVVVARVRWVRGAPLSIRSLPRADALGLAMDSIQDTGARPTPSLERLSALVEGADPVDVTFGRSQDAAAALRDLVP